MTYENKIDNNMSYTKGGDYKIVDYLKALLIAKEADAEITKLTKIVNASALVSMDLNTEIRDLKLILESKDVDMEKFVDENIVIGKENDALRAEVKRLKDFVVILLPETEDMLKLMEEFK